MAVAIVVILLLFSYSLALSLTSRRPRREIHRAPEGLFVVFVVPCLNEELVIGARWFPGHLQCWRRTPIVLRSHLPARAVFDLVQHLLSPALVLLLSLPIALFYSTLITLVFVSPHKLLEALQGTSGVVVRMVTRKGQWAKTARTVDAPAVTT